MRLYMHINANINYGTKQYAHCFMVSSVLMR